MYIVRNYTALMYLEPTCKINAVLSPVPFNNRHGILGRIAWSNSTLLNASKTYVRYQQSSKRHYPPDTDPYTDQYTYIPIGASIHDVQYIHDFENHSNYINLLTWYLNANN